MDGPTSSHPDAHTAADAPHQFPRPHCSCAHSGCSSFTRPTSLPWAHSTNRESVERLNHRASFAESAFYAILHSHALKEKDDALEATKIQRLMESVETLAQQSLTLTKNMKLSNDSLQKKLDASVLEMAASQATYELKLRDAQDVMKASVEELRAEFRDSTTILLEDLRIDTLGVVTDLQDDVRETRGRLAQREVELAEAKEALTQEKHNLAISNNDVRLLAEEVFRLTKGRAEDAVRIQELRLQAQKQSFAVRQMTTGRYTPEEWMKNAPEELLPLDLGAELTILGHRFLERNVLPNVTSHEDTSAIKEPAVTTILNIYDDNRGSKSEAGPVVWHEPQEDCPVDCPVCSPETADEFLDTLLGSPAPAQSLPEKLDGLPKDFGEPDTVTAALSGATNLQHLEPSWGHVPDETVPPPPASTSGPPSDLLDPVGGTNGLNALVIAIDETVPKKIRKQPTKKALKWPGSALIPYTVGQILTNVELGQTFCLGTNPSGQRGWFRRSHVHLYEVGGNY